MLIKIVQFGDNGFQCNFKTEEAFFLIMRTPIYAQLDVYSGLGMLVRMMVHLVLFPIMMIPLLFLTIA